MLFFLGFVLSALGIGFALFRFLPGWPHWLLIIAAALPVPVVILGFCVFIFFSAAHNPHEECGVDACGMAMAASMMVGAFTLLGLLLGIIAAAILSTFVKTK